MGIFGIVPRILDALNDGRVIKRAVSYALRFAAVLAAIAALLLAITVAKVAFGPGTTAEISIAFSLFLILYLLSTVCQVQILFYRSKSVLNLESSRYTVVPVVSILFRAAGEFAATNLCFVGLGATLAIWVSKQNPLGLVGMNALMPAFNSSDSFLAGALLLAWTFLLAFVVLLFFYFLAEVSLVGVDIAQNVRHLVPPPPPFVPPPPSPIAPSPSMCSVCRFELKSSDQFCPICGTARPF